MSTNNCENCRFWKLAGEKSTWGECRRHAPSNDYQLPWPRTGATDSCGEFELSEAAKAAADTRKPAGEAITQSAEVLLSMVRGHQYGLQFGSGAIREGRRFNDAEMAVTIMALDRLARPLTATQQSLGQGGEK